MKGQEMNHALVIYTYILLLHYFIKIFTPVIDVQLLRNCHISEDNFQIGNTYLY